MISEPTTIRSAFAEATTANEFVEMCKDTDLATKLVDAELRNWQWQACVAFFNVKIQYCTHFRYLIKHEDLDKISSDELLCELTNECNRRRLDLTTLGIRETVIAEINTLCNKLSKAPVELPKDPFLDQ